MQMEQKPEKHSYAWRNHGVPCMLCCWGPSWPGRTPQEKGLQPDEAGPSRSECKHCWRTHLQQKKWNRNQTHTHTHVCLQARLSDCGVTLTTRRPSSLTVRETKRLTRANSYVVMHCSSHKHHVTRSGHFLLLQLPDVLRWQRENDLQCEVMYIINHSVRTYTHARTHTLWPAGFPHLLFRCC